MGGVGGEGVGVLVVRIFAAVVGSGLPREGDAGVVVGVDGLAEVDGVLQLLLQHLLTRVSGQLQEEETRVGLWQEVVRRVVLVQHLRTDEESVIKPTSACSSTLLELKQLPGTATVSLHVFEMSYLHDEIPTTEVSDGAWKPSTTPDEPQEKGPLRVGEGLHHLPEPLDQGRGGLHSLVCGH